MLFVKTSCIIVFSASWAFQPLADSIVLNRLTLIVHKYFK
jgi:hypothetical protein